MSQAADEEAERSGFSALSRTHVGIVREVNEDRVLVQSQFGLWAVADGMGGHSLGDRAAASVVCALTQIKLKVPSREAITAALHSANASIVAMARQAGVTCGSTVAGLSISQGGSFVFWVGDSRVYRLRAGVLDRLTIDHSVVQELCDAGMLTEQQARLDPRKNIITRAIGITDNLNVDFAPVDVDPGDLFLICSDGLSDMVEDAGILRLVDQGRLEEIADSLVRASLTGGGTDNVSLIVVASNDE